MPQSLQDPTLALLSQYLSDSGFPVSVHWPEPAAPLEWLETTIPDVLADQAMALRLMTLESLMSPAQSPEDPEQGDDDDDEELPPMSLVRIDALLPLAIDWEQLPLTLAAIEAMNDLLPFGGISLRPQAARWAWQYTLPAPDLGSAAALAMRVIESLRFYIEALAPTVAAALEDRAEPGSIGPKLRAMLGEFAQALEADDEADPRAADHPIGRA